MRFSIGIADTRLRLIAGTPVESTHASGEQPTPLQTTGKHQVRMEVLDGVQTNRIKNSASEARMEMQPSGKRQSLLTLVREVAVVTDRSTHTVIHAHIPEPLQPLPFSKWRHFKEAFSSELVYDAIASYGDEIKYCIDPFGGSGTTALACQFAGIVPTTIEVNPYLADLIESKLQTYDIDQLVRDLTTILRSADKVDPTTGISQLPKTFVEPGSKDRWLFSREVANRIQSLCLAIDSLETAANRRLFKILLGSILVPMSNAIVNGKGRRYRKNWNRLRRSEGEVDLLFTQAASSAIQEIRRFENRICTAYTLIRGDSRELIDGLGPFDLAVFSPPYPNSFDYTDVYNIELWMLGYLTDPGDNADLRERTLSSHVQIHRDYAPAPAGSPLLEETLALLRLNVDQLWNRNIPAMVGAYFAEMLTIMRRLKRVLTEKGEIWIVVGDSSYAGIGIGVANILADFAALEGMVVQRNECLREMRKSAQQGGQEQLAESLLVIRRR